MGKRVVGSFVAALAWIVLLGTGVSPAVQARLVNIDIDGNAPNDTTYGCADGVLSSIGTVWNGASVGWSVPNLLDPLGSPTPVELAFVSAFGTVDEQATNDLQDSGASGAFQVKGCSAVGTYDVAVYAFPFSLLSFTDANGPQNLFCNTTSSPSHVLPGTAGADYCLFEDVMPADLGGGAYGFVFDGIDGAVMGVQIAGPGGVGPPTVSALSLPGAVALVPCLIGTACGQRVWPTLRPVASGCRRLS